MKGIASKLMVLFIVTAVVLMPALSGVYAQDTFTEEKKTTPGLMTLDLLLVRPAGLLATALGSAVFIVWLPFSAITKDTALAGQKLVQEPASYTFKRPLGFF